MMVPEQLRGQTVASAQGDRGIDVMIMPSWAKRLWKGMPVARGEDVDWKFLCSSNGEHWFFDLRSMMRLDGQVFVWMKCLSAEAVRSVYEGDGGRATASAQQKIAEGYVPPIATVENMPKHKGVILLEAVANIGGIEPIVRIYLELALEAGAVRELIVRYPDGTGTDTPSEWRPACGETNAANLLRMVNVRPGPPQ